MGFGTGMTNVAATGDEIYCLLLPLADDRLLLPHLKAHITGFDHVVEMARRAGAKAVTLSGEGPAITAFASENHAKIATAMEVAFENVGVKARSWVLPIDRQGVVISVAQSS